MKCEWHLCGNELVGRQRSFCSRNCKNKFYVTRNRRNNKIKLVEMFGGKCERCGYNKSVAALHFHHINNDKEFAIGQAGMTRSWSELVSEASKCELICANCHAEHHSPVG